MRSSRHVLEGALREALDPIIPSTYHVELKIPLIFACTRVGELGSALYVASESADANPSISMSDVRTIIRFCDSPDAGSVISAAGRKFLVTSVRPKYVHARCVSSIAHRGGLFLTRSQARSGYTIAVMYEAPSDVHEATDIAAAIEKEIKSLAAKEKEHGGDAKIVK